MKGVYMYDYVDEIIYYSDYLDYIDPDYLEKINSDDHYYTEVIRKLKFKNIDFHNNSDIV